MPPAPQVLSLARAGYTKECYNGAYVETRAYEGLGYPAEGDCVDQEDCDPAQLAGLGAPAHVETGADPSADVAHGEKVEYVCTEGRKMMSMADEDDDEKVN